jgi:hypothetical protein
LKHSQIQQERGRQADHLMSPVYERRAFVAAQAIAKSPGCAASTVCAAVMPSRQYRAAPGSDLIDFREFLLGLGEVAELNGGVRSPQVTPQRGYRMACGPPEHHRPAAELKPLAHRLRDGDGQVPRGQRLEDGARFAGPLGLGQRLRCHLRST